MGVLINKPITISLASATGLLPVVRAAAERIAGMVGFDDHCIGQMILALDEALANVIQHAYEGADDGRIDIRFKAVNDGRAGLEIVIRDFGRQVDPSTIASRDLDDVRPGGLGVHIMRNCMEEIEYTHLDDGGTRLRMVKYVPSINEKSSAPEHGAAHGE